MAEYTAYLKTLPNCQLHETENPPAAEYDALVEYGNWYYLCAPCFKKNALHPDGKFYCVKLIAGEEPF